MSIRASGRGFTLFNSDPQLVDRVSQNRILRAFGDFRFLWSNETHKAKKNSSPRNCIKNNIHARNYQDNYCDTRCQS